MQVRFGLSVIAVLTVFTWSHGCQKAYYSVWEKLGKEKRHLLKDNVQDAKNEQEKASEQFKDALTLIRDLYAIEGGDLEKFYDKLQADYKACENRAAAVNHRIGRVEEVARDLFAEWEEEIRQIGNEEFKAKSRQALKDTRERYARLHTAMIRARSTMAPVLGSLRDYVLYLKHNLNARAIGALKQEVAQIEAEVKTLVDDINSSIREADSFLKTFE